jgi:membrane-bound lytic murein transglycosylase D
MPPCSAGGTFLFPPPPRDAAPPGARLEDRRLINRALALALAAAALAACSRATAPAISPVRSALEIAPSPDSAAPSAASADAVAGDSVELSPTEVAEGAAEVFGDSLVAVDEAPSWDIDVRSYETHARVERYVRAFTGAARGRFEERLSRGTRYEPMIRAKFRAAGLPEDMYYLALVESGYNPNAYSRAAAVGMWQFMTGTAKGVGLRVDWWVDERRDPVRSTDGAIRFLKHLNEQFGSMYLAAAAYNGGPGRVSRGLTRYADDLEGVEGDEAFFALSEKDHFKGETREYVPQLIAAALIAKEPGKYGVTIETLRPFAYDSVRVGPATPLAAVARAVGAPLDSIVELNSMILRGVTPPTGSYTVRVPPGAAAGFDSVYATLDSADRKAFRKVVSKKGETLVTIARRHDLTSRQLGWYNPMLRKSKKTGALVPGQVVLVPSHSVVLAARDIPDPKVERYPTSRITHVVRRGETLSHIARRYRTTVKEIQRLNGLRKSIILPGQELLVRPGGSARTRR